MASSSSLSDHHHLVKRESGLESSMGNDDDSNPFEESLSSTPTTVSSSLYGMERPRALYACPTISINGLLSSHAVRKDVNLSTSCIEVIRRPHVNHSSNSLGVSQLERYCESPFLLEPHHRSSDLISDDDASNQTGGRVSRLSEAPDDLFSVSGVLGDCGTQHHQSSMLRDVVVTPTPLDSSRITPNMLMSNGSSKIDEMTLHRMKEETKLTSDGEDLDDVDDDECILRDPPLNHLKSSQSFVSVADRCIQTNFTSVITATGHVTSLQTNGENNHHQPHQTHLPSSSSAPESPTSTSTQPLVSSTTGNSSPGSSRSIIVSTSGGTVEQVTSAQPLDIKILPAGLIQLASNLAAVFPSSSLQKQIAIQLLRDDGTSIILPITTLPRVSPATISTAASSTPTPETTILLGSAASAGVAGNNSKNSKNQSKSVGSGDAPPVTPSASNVTQESATQSQNSESDRPFKCELCNSTFTRLGNYTRHKKIHSLPTKEDQRFRCEICGKSFIQRCDLARHLHIHRGTEPHRCPQCGKGYIRHSDLVTHQRFHNKEKPFACPQCSKGFCQRGDLNRHLRSIHLQLKPILCTHCHKKFAKEETLLRHINASHRDKLLDQ